MANEHKDGGQAFPGHNRNGYPTQGMSLRDYFAGQALVQLMAANDSFVAGFDGAKTAADAYTVADAMLTERAKTGGAA